MDLKQLQLLKELSEAGSLSKVCASRGIAQSVLSKQIGSLEKEFGAKLFYRTGRGVVLTELGQAVLPRVNALLAEADLLQHELRERAGVPSGPVRLALQTSITQILVGPLFQRVRKDYPQIQLRLMEGFSGLIEEALANGRADVGVLSRYGSKTSPTDEDLGTDDLYFIGKSGDRRVEGRSIAFADIGGLPLVLPGVPDGLRMMLADVARKRGVALNVDIEVDSLTAMKAIVAGGAAYTVLTRQAVQSELELERVQATRIVEPVLTRTLVLATSSQRPLTSAIRTVAELIRQLVGDRRRGAAAGQRAAGPADA